MKNTDLNAKIYSITNNIMTEEKKESLKAYDVNYTFDGSGTVTLKAKSKEEAEEKWRNGFFDVKDETEGGDQYEVTSVEETDDELESEKEIKARLEYLRGEIEQEQISTEEITELQRRN